MRESLLQGCLSRELNPPASTENSRKGDRRLISRGLGNNPRIVPANFRRERVRVRVQGVRFRASRSGKDARTLRIGWDGRLDRKYVERIEAHAALSLCLSSSGRLSLLILDSKAARIISDRSEITERDW